MGDRSSIHYNHDLCVVILIYLTHNQSSFCPEEGNNTTYFSCDGCVLERLGISVCLFLRVEGLTGFDDVMYDRV